MRSYGSIDASLVHRPSVKRASIIKTALIALSAVVATTLFITLAALSRASFHPVSVLAARSSSARTHSTQVVSLDEAGEDVHPITGPTFKDAEAFKKAADDALDTISIDDISKTALADSCGIALYPCAQKIIGCADSRLVRNRNGEVTPLTSACDCFIQGFTESIEIPGKLDAEFSCPLACVEDLLSVTVEYVALANKESGATFTCDLSDLASRTIGNKYHYIPTATDSEPVEIVPVDDPHVLRAAEALRMNFNAARLINCPATKTYDDPGKIEYAKRGMVGGGLSQYKLEVVFGNDVVFARLAHLGESEQTVDPSTRMALNDTDNLNGRFQLMSSTPGPCEDAMPEQLAVSAAGSEAINKQKLPWTAMLTAEHEGKRVKDFGLGFKPLSEEEHKAFYVELDITDFVPPTAYDSRDIYAGQVPCKAYQVLNQGGCGCCYAFSTATAYSARLCRFNPTSTGNIVLSPQQLLDCTSGCNGGNPIGVYQSMLSNPNVEMWCDPYRGVKKQCNSVCGNGNTYTGQPGSVRSVGGAGPVGNLQMQLELLRGGPGVVGLMVKNDLMGYSRGIYIPSPRATDVGAHAVVLIGWGVEAGVPYWICQNSWGAGWGENGFFRIKRGSDTATIESRTGMVVIKPLPPTACPNTKCANGAITREDCTCQCDGLAKTGATCRTCALSCKNGGVLDAACTKCSCPLGYSGPMCEGGYKLAPLASCSGDSTSITVTYSFGGATLPPMQTSFVGIYPLAKTGPFKALATGAICGSVYPKYSRTVDGGLCPSTGTFKFSPPSTPGQYKVVVAPYSPPDAQGIQGFYALKSSNIIAQFTVLPKGCAAADRAIALASNNPAAILSGQLAAAAAAEAAQLAAMKSRLDTAVPLLATLRAELPSSLTITGMSSTTPLVWAGSVQQICYRIPPSQNVNPKNLVLYVGDGSAGTFYPSALGVGDANLPTDYQGCVPFAVSTGVPLTTYTIMLQDPASGNSFARVSFQLAKATVAFSTLSLSSTQLTLTASWSVTANLASVKDMVKVVNSKNTVVYWFYTSCKCQRAPGATAVPSGSLAFKLLKLNSVPGGYTVTFRPAGTNVVAAAGANWIPWAKIGW